MILLVTLLLGSGLALLAGRSPRRHRVGWALIMASLAVAVADGGWMGLLALIGLVPVAAVAIMLDRSYRPGPLARAAGALTIVVVVGWLGRLA